MDLSHCDAYVGVGFGKAKQDRVSQPQLESNQNVGSKIFPNRLPARSRPFLEPAWCAATGCSGARGVLADQHYAAALSPQQLWLRLAGYARARRGCAPQQNAVGAARGRVGRQAVCLYRLQRVHHSQQPASALHPPRRQTWRRRTQQLDPVAVAGKHKGGRGCSRVDKVFSRGRSNILCLNTCFFGSGLFYFVPQTGSDLASQQIFVNCNYYPCNNYAIDAVHERARQVARQAALPTVHRRELAALLALWFVNFGCAV